MTSSVDREPLNLLVIMPAYNEADSLEGVITEVKLFIPPESILVVDDGSQDETSRVAASMGVKYLQLPFNMGVGGAMRAGFRFAQQRGYSAVVQLDSDGQHKPEYIASLTAQLDTADIVVGARFAGAGDYRVTGPRKWAMGFLSFALSRICKTRLTDTTSGYKAIGPRALKVFCANYPAEYLGDTVEALVIAAKSGLTVTQVPVVMRERAAGEPSHGAFKSAVYLVRAIIALFIGLSKPTTKVGM